MNFGEISEENQHTTEEFLFIAFLFSLFKIIRLPQHFIVIHNLY